MKRNKHSLLAIITQIVICVFLFASIYPFAGQAQSTMPQNAIQVLVNQYQQNGDQLLVNIRYQVSGEAMTKRQELTINPVLKTIGHEQLLRPITLQGNVRHKKHLRKQALSPTTIDLQDSVYYIQRNTRQEIDYHVNIPFEPWMKTAQLYLQYRTCACKNSQLIEERMLSADLLLEKTPAPYIPPFKVAKLRPVADTLKSSTEEGSTYLKYPAGKALVDPAYQDNMRQLVKIHTLLERLTHQDKVNIQTISITGSSSIEGPSEVNKRIATNRAIAFENYLKKEYPLTDTHFEINSIGEDWEGLANLIQADNNMPKADEALQIIRASSRLDQREGALKRLAGGVPYRYIEKNYFPLLRRVDYRVIYTIKSFTAEERQTMVQQQAHQLSLYELYAVADSYPEDSDEFNAINYLAVSIFPDQAIANLNAMSAAIRAEQFEKAGQYALKSAKGGALLNNQAILLYLQHPTDEGSRREAKQLFEQAIKDGCVEAQGNLQLVNEL